MGWSEAVVICRVHPDEKPQPGICPCCLRDRLSRIVARNSRIFNKTTYSSSNSPNYSFQTSPVYYYYCSSSSGAASQPPSRRHQRVASDVIDSIYMAISGAHGLRKSRSMAYAAPRDGEGDNSRRKKNKGGFWNKLLTRKKV